jgi:hypothetical protein
MVIWPSRESSLLRADYSGHPYGEMLRFDEEFVQELCVT